MSEFDPEPWQPHRSETEPLEPEPEPPNGEKPFYPDEPVHPAVLPDPPDPVVPDTIPAGDPEEPEPN